MIFFDGKRYASVKSEVFGKTPEKTAPIMLYKRRSWGGDTSEFEERLIRRDLSISTKICIDSKE